MKINGREVHGSKHSSYSSIDSLNKSLKSTSSHKVRKNNPISHTFDDLANSKNVSSSDDVSHISQINNLRDIVRDFSSSKWRKDAQFEQTFSKIILIIIFGPMILNLIVSIISAIFYSLTAL